ncbi:MAG TPA: penicillin-binding transpeptidase domain-containing protein [Terriglobia bacterium]|nr:penicillin-binding transpeptidase domain-containing protein [Terriglobia bacterium]
MKKVALLALLLVTWTTRNPSASLYDQSMAAVLRRQFSSPSISYLVIDVATGMVVASRWENLDQPVPTGSLVKPFTALAYGASHGYRYPELTCHGAADGCWLPRGHGRIGMTEAIGYSCNAYFRKLAARISREDAERVTLRYGIGGPLRSFSPATLVGLDAEMKMPPEQMARAYIELRGHAGDPGVTELLEGMALSARAGTASAIQKSLPGAPALAKTGTSACVHTPRAPGDGYTIILYPADIPRWALLVRVHGVPGASAARVGGEMLRTIVTGR